MALDLFAVLECDGKSWMNCFWIMQVAVDCFRFAVLSLFFAVCLPACETSELLHLTRNQIGWYQVVSTN